MLDIIEQLLASPQTTPDSFNAAMQAQDITFSLHRSDQSVHELIPGGAAQHVTYHTHTHFTHLYTTYRLTEFTEQCEAMRRGLATVVPYQLLPLLTWREVELSVCGAASVDVDKLQAMTVYESGVSAQDSHVKVSRAVLLLPLWLDVCGTSWMLSHGAVLGVQLFWRMLRERFDDEQRAKFLNVCHHLFAVCRCPLSYFLLHAVFVCCSLCGADQCCR